MSETAFRRHDCAGSLMLNALLRGLDSASRLGAFCKGEVGLAARFVGIAISACIAEALPRRLSRCEGVFFVKRFVVLRGADGRLLVSYRDTSVRAVA
ncbi:hypothetical protein P9239_01680 [Caballeronia sp. LZ062]|uniref:hypothetical protein n=1 Tax=unclassified Caballeronia TaxID=2646786 RepID=UPI00285D9A21|nr:MULTISPECIES: hypothetical protein [unclassified Caballeronia]MDR5857519.1 hypothetical protein [Caballeronia sp. LZ050]MDR5869069.1 hypothetical protein [Caballeronia sp. LZ062]